MDTNKHPYSLNVPPPIDMPKVPVLIIDRSDAVKMMRTINREIKKVHSGLKRKKTDLNPSEIWLG